ncbi:unknown [Firmicutes bacterium CAG:884]|nr:unknown [Firmicutes bacterium CAG:884]
MSCNENNNKPKTSINYIILIVLYILLAIILSTSIM